MTTLFAVCGPGLEAPTVNVAFVPTLGARGSTDFVTTRLTRSSTAALAELLPGVGSAWSEWETAAVLVMDPAVVTVATSVSTLDAPLARLPIVQVPAR